MHRVLRRYFFSLLLRPVVYFLLGVNVRRHELLPRKGPAIIVANHNSHLDTIVLMTICPKAIFDILRPVAAADYFLSNPLLSWFSQRVLRIIPIDRHAQGVKCDPLEPVEEALQRGEVVIIFPEGSRGDPEQLSEFKSGVAHLAKRAPEIPIIPVFLYGLGKALPRGEVLLVPFFCDVFVGEALHWNGGKREFMEALNLRMKTLAEEGNFPLWE